MAVRVFDGVNDVIVLDEGTIDNIFNGAFTIVVGFRKDAETTDVTQFLLSFDGGVNTDQRAAISLDGSNNVQLTISGLTRTFTGQTTTNGTHYMWVVTKANGTATPRANLFSYSSDTWSGWTNGSDTLDNDTTALVEVRIGNGPGSFPLSGRFWIGAAFTNVVADATAEGFADSAADILNAGPAAMWRPGMTDPVSDDTGNGANQTSIVDTTIDSTSDPDPFDFAITAAPQNVGHQSTAFHPGRGPLDLARFFKRAMSTETINDANIAPTEVLAAASIPVPTVSAGSTALAATVAATSSVGTITFQSDVLITPATVNATTTIPAPTLSAGSNIVAVTVVGITSVPAPTIQAGSVVTHTTVAAVTSVPTPVVSAGGSATALPATVASAASIPAPTVQASSTVSAATVQATTSVPLPTIPLGPTTVVAVAVIATPTIIAGSTIVASNVSATTTIPTPTIIIRTQPSVVLCTVAIAAPTIISGSSVSPAVVLGSTNIPFPTIVAIVPPPLPADYEIDLTPISTPISQLGQSVEANLGVSA